MTIERVKNLSPSEFYREFYLRDRPVIIEDCVKDWPATKRWSPAHLSDVLGDLTVKAERLIDPVSNGGDVAAPADGSAKLTRLPGNRRTFQQEDLTLREYFARVQGESNNDWYVTLQPVATLAAIRDDVRPFPYYSSVLQRLAMHQPLLWLAPRGTVSNLHFDKLPNFVVQFWGEKEWVIFDRRDSDRVYLPSNLPIPQFSPIDMEDPDLQRFPKLRYAREERFILRRGETLFLPSHWPHHVKTLELSISMNFWWLTRREIPQLPKTWMRRARAQLRRGDGGYGG